MYYSILEKLDSNIAYHIMSYVGPHPLAGIMKPYIMFIELNIFPKRNNWCNFNLLFGYMHRGMLHDLRGDRGLEKYFITYSAFIHEGDT
jgi:hypothetical protein